MPRDGAPAVLELAGGARVLFTDRTHGDFAVPDGGPGATLLERRRALVGLPWSWVRQVHGGAVRVVDAPGDGAGEEADALVTAAPGAVLAVHVADCAPVALASPEGIVAAVHAGWRGVDAGVIGNAVDAMRGLGATAVEAAIGPCIRPECYEFGATDLDRVASRLGDAVRSRTTSGAPALDLPAAVRAALGLAGAEVVADAGTCTACSARHWSHRARRDAQRHALAVWREP